MPWCDDCARFYNPNTLSSTGACPEGHEVVDPDEAAERTKAPWHFWVLIAALVIYLGWRLIEGIGWVAGRLF